MSDLDFNEINKQLRERRSPPTVPPLPEPRRGRLGQSFTDADIAHMGHQELKDTGYAYGPTQATMREGTVTNEPRAFRQPRSYRPTGTYRRWTLSPLVYVIVGLLWLFVCIIPAIRIILSGG